MNSNVIGPGVWLGQLLDQTVVYEFNNNSDLFFQPASEALFQDVCLRLADMHVISVSANVTGIPTDPDNRLWFPDGNVNPQPGELGQITVVFYWEVRCVGVTQNASPWAAAKSGNKYKYTAVGTPVSIPPAVPSLTATKSAPVCLDIGQGPVTYTVTFENTTGNANGVPVYLKSIGGCTSVIYWMQCNRESICQPAEQRQFVKLEQLSKRRRRFSGDLGEQVPRHCYRRQHQGLEDTEYDRG